MCAVVIHTQVLLPMYFVPERHPVYANFLHHLAIQAAGMLFFAGFPTHRAASMFAYGFPYRDETFAFKPYILQYQIAWHIIESQKKACYSAYGNLRKVRCRLI